MEGGRGNDTLYGGSGTDRFDFSNAVGTDDVHYFEAKDTIRISGYGAALNEFSDLHVSVFGEDTHINLSASVAGAGEIILRGITHVEASDFIFV